jgi:hypothetical protein
MTAFDPKQRLERYETQEFRMPDSVRALLLDGLIGIDPDYRLHVSERLLTQRDGPMLEAIKGLNGGLLRLPKRIMDHPDRDRLALRFDRFKAAG